ncbi:hypothetical protein FNV43_RR25577 [Rhamnella rubrinervis]|uniref:Uncharacterized protein n=1 Tax=Rhamnella rubrinervis TaxID=2594499 RepID=A0A8K0DUG0_9ROSA|nr:hypothetical protein FNV43_RR25577 [Rhamnella rubrinervis]
MNTIFTDFVQEINLGDTNAHSKSVVDDSDNVESGIKHSSKIGHGFSHKGGDGGQSTDNGNNPGSRSPNTQSGSNNVPVYAAGAVNNHHPVHHGAGNCNQNCVGLSTIIATTLISLVQLYITFRYGY